MMIKESFNNLDNLKQMKCPLFILHGLKDDLVPISHAKELYSAYEHEVDLTISKEMGHGFVNPKADFMVPFQNFMRKIEIREKREYRNGYRIIRIPRKMYAMPPSLNSISRKEPTKASHSSVSKETLN
jgi:fermentation-respiration switch protein FrsA (DUF1100 family)